MNSQPAIYHRNKPSVTKIRVNYGFTKVNKTFGAFLKQKMDESGIKAAELSRLSGVTKQNIGRLINNTPHTISGAVPTASKETVEKLAKALNWNLDEAMRAAGFAAGESHEILEGVSISFTRKQMTQKEKDEILDVVKTVVAGIKARKENE